MTITKEQADVALKGLAALAKDHPNADALEYVRHETVVSYIEQLEAENKRLREAALSRSIEVTSYRSALMQIKSAQERHVSGEVSTGVPAYKMLEAWQIADKALAQPDEKESK